LSIMKTLFSLASGRVDLNGALISILLGVLFVVKKTLRR
jgi:hypothetical protein